MRPGKVAAARGTRLDFLPIRSPINADFGGSCAVLEQNALAIVVDCCCDNFGAPGAVLVCDFSGCAIVREGTGSGDEGPAGDGSVIRTVHVASGRFMEFVGGEGVAGRRRGSRTSAETEGNIHNLCGGGEFRWQGKGIYPGT